MLFALFEPLLSRRNFSMLGSRSITTSWARINALIFAEPCQLNRRERYYRHRDALSEKTAQLTFRRRRYDGFACCFPSTQRSKAWRLRQTAFEVPEHQFFGMALGVIEVIAANKIDDVLLARHGITTC